MFEEGKVPSSVCRVLVAYNNGWGVALWWDGDITSEDVTYVGTNLESLGLQSDQTPRGLSVWEGRYYPDTGDPEDCEWNPKGTYRELTNTEWGYVCRGECPWPKTAP